MQRCGYNKKGTYEALHRQPGKCSRRLYKRKKALSLVADPYEGDITDFLQDGRNRIELVCYNTLYNHMLTIPTNYNYEKSPDWRLDI